MKITPQLLVRYQQNRCTPAEVRAVEQWLLATDDESSSLTEAQLARMQTEIWDAISPEVLGSKSNKIIPLPKRVTRYAAAACVIIGTFFLGYFAALPSAQADTVEKPKHLADLLHVYGGDGTYGTVAGSRFRVKFEGSLRLYNEAKQTKQIVCGEQKFTLEPYETYCLIGSDEKATLLGENQIYDIDHEEDELTRDFLVQRLDD
ncbi:MAG: hypothetical protein AAF632_14040 [Bacteroidota bacterium]